MSDDAKKGNGVSAKTQVDAMVAQAQPAPQPMGVQQEIEGCAGCGQPMRKAFLKGAKLSVFEIYVDHMPNEWVLPDGRVLLLFEPHNRTCKAPKRGLVMPNGKMKIL